MTNFVIALVSRINWGRAVARTKAGFSLTFAAYIVRIICRLRKRSNTINEFPRLSGAAEHLKPTGFSMQQNFLLSVFWRYLSRVLHYFVMTKKGSVASVLSKVMCTSVKLVILLACNFPDKHLLRSAKSSSFFWTSRWCVRLCGWIPEKFRTVLRCALRLGRKLAVERGLSAFCGSAFHYAMHAGKTLDFLWYGFALAVTVLQTGYIQPDEFFQNPEITAGTRILSVITSL